MSSYYYAISSLPMLFYEMEDIYLDIPDFLSFCRAWIPKYDYKLLEAASIKEVQNFRVGNSTLKKWNQWEITLRNELVSLRAKEKKEDAQKYLVENEEVLGLANIAREAFTQTSPLSGEEILNKARWQFLDELESGHHFDIDKLIVFHLKLQILSRKSLFQKEKGRENFEKIFEQMQE